LEKLGYLLPTLHPNIGPIVKGNYYQSAQIRHYFLYLALPTVVMEELPLLYLTYEEEPA
jgi:hypothetical protein